MYDYTSKKTVPLLYHSHEAVLLPNHGYTYTEVVPLLRVHEYTGKENVPISYHAKEAMPLPCHT